MTEDKTWGGKRPGAGRPRKSEEEIRQRKLCSMRAHLEEWEVIKRFARALKKDFITSEEMVSRLESEVYRYKRKGEEDGQKK